MSRLCPRCLHRFPDSAQTCPDDGVSLIEAPGSRADPLIGTVLVDRYRILGRIGGGAMGVVYRAQQLAMGRDVAVKVLNRSLAGSEDMIERFLFEARTASRLTHPNTITLFDFGANEDGLLFFAMELLDGRPLSAAIRQQAPFSQPRAVSIAIQVCNSLAEAHQSGIVHRDVKPDNIFLVPRPENPDFVKVLDFGVAKLMAERARVSITDPGIAVGTPAYMSPEQFEGAAVSAATDVYALGVVLFEMLTGQRPFLGGSTHGVGEMHLHTPVPSLASLGRPDLPDELDRLLQRMMGKHPLERPRDMTELRQELLRSLHPELEGPITQVVGRPSAPGAPPSTPLASEVSPGEGGVLVPSRLRLATPVPAAATPLLTASLPAPGPEQRSRPLPALLGGLGILGLLLGTGVWLLGQQDVPAGLTEPQSAAVADPGVGGPTPAPGSGSGSADAQRGMSGEPADQPLPTASFVRIGSSPAGANVSLGETFLGKTPFEWAAPVSADRPVLTFSLAGYASVERPFAGTDLSVHLEPVARPPRVRPASVPRPRPRPADTGTHAEESGIFLQIH